MRRILVSLLTISAVALVAFGASQAFFSDTETSTGNKFEAGSLDLKVDSTAHYNGATCIFIEDNNGGHYEWDNSNSNGYPVDGTPCDGTWEESNLGFTTKFFNLTDVKPGDSGENTVSLHVYDNDAWGRFVVHGLTNKDNTCTEAEDESESGGQTECLASGELSENITFYAWLDQGETPGFQNADPSQQPVPDDNGEGNNVWDCNAAIPEGGNKPDPYSFSPQMAGNNCNEPLVILPGTVQNNEYHNIWETLAPIYAAYCTSMPSPTNGHNSYGLCHGLASDGRMVGSTTYYFGLAWFVPDTVGNEVQTDSLEADLTFQVVQHRNNPTPTGFPNVPTP